MPDETTEPTVQPQLEPLQQQFLQSLRNAPTGAVPFSGGGGPGLMGFSGPGYAVGYQPAQSFNDPAYQQKLYEWEQEVRRTAEAARAEQAIQSGIRYIYQRRYDEDLKKGVPEPTAFSRMMLGIAMHGPKTDPIKAFEAFRQPPPPAITNIGGRDILRSGRYGERAVALPAPIPTGPVPTEAFIGTGGQPIPGVRAARGTGGALHILKETPEEAKASPSLNFQMLKTAIATTTKDLEEFSKDDPEYKPLKARLDSLKTELEGMRQKKPAGTPKAESQSTNEVTRLTKDGRRAIFNATTKEFIRYAD